MTKIYGYPRKEGSIRLEGDPQVDIVQLGCDGQKALQLCMHERWQKEKSGTGCQFC